MTFWGSSDQVRLESSSGWFPRVVGFGGIDPWNELHTF